MNDYELLQQHLKALDDINYVLDFRDLYNFHRDIWITIDHADYIPLSEMGYEHLKNSLAFVERNDINACYGLGPLWKRKLIKEIQRRDRINNKVNNKL